MMLRLLRLSLFVSFLFAACENRTERKQSSQDAAVAEDPSSNLSHEGTAVLISLLEDYYDLKNALVASDAYKAGEAARTLQSSAEYLQQFIQDSTQLLYKYIQDIHTQAGHIAKAKKDAEWQRIPFRPLSDAVYALIKKTHLKNLRIYRQYCPMAFHNKGAHWLSAEEKISNPYFGNKMLTCGEITETLN